MKWWDGLELGFNLPKSRGFWFAVLSLCNLAVNGILFVYMVQRSLLIKMAALFLAQELLMKATLKVSLKQLKINTINK